MLPLQLCVCSLLVEGGRGALSPAFRTLRHLRIKPGNFMVRGSLNEHVLRKVRLWFLIGRSLNLKLINICK